MKIKHREWVGCVDNIRQLRRFNGIPQVELARQIKVSKGTIGGIESYNGTSVEVLCKIADFFNVSISELFRQPQNKGGEKMKLWKCICRKSDFTDKGQVLIGNIYSSGEVYFKGASFHLSKEQEWEIDGTITLTREDFELCVQMFSEIC
jgi:transcriptional regulator with XRE-family HTH domain